MVLYKHVCREVEFIRTRIHRTAKEGSKLGTSLDW